jgi:DNA-directed RNA polymerase subunit M/transcription elongation factor TFIIS
MVEAEKRRQSVTEAEVEQTQAALATAKVPSPRNPRPADEGQPAEYACQRCGHRWSAPFHVVERTCPNCRSNSVRWLRP